MPRRRNSVSASSQARKFARCRTGSIGAQYSIVMLLDKVMYGPPKGDVMTYRASCGCGQLQLACEGEPVRISMCHCLACQRRTGSVFGVQARFPRDQVTVVEGRSAQFSRRRTAAIRSRSISARIAGRRSIGSWAECPTSSRSPSALLPIPASPNLGTPSTKPGGIHGP